MTDYITVKDFFDSIDYNAEIPYMRKKYKMYLDKNDYFGCRIYYPDEIGGNGKEYLSVDDAKIILEKSEEFLNNCGKTFEQKLQEVINDSKLSDDDLENLLDYINTLKKNPSTINAAQVLCSIPNPVLLDNNDVLQLLDSCTTQISKKKVKGYLNYLKKIRTTSYGKIEDKQKTKQIVEAYSLKMYSGLAECIFNEKNIERNNMIEKALHNSTDCERWLYLSCFYICAWRGNDICNAWIYPDLQNNNIFNLNTETLYEDLENDQIPKAKLAEICDYTLQKIKLSGRTPSKTRKNTLDLNILQNLKPHFGRLLLIAEYHHLQDSQTGHMKENKRSEYMNWIQCRKFFGLKMYELIGQRNIKGTRLNKCYLQSIEKTARENGNSPISAHIIASIARNHNNIATTSIYLQDANLTGEDAGTILYLMAERGVSSMYLYKTLMEAYPDSFAKLSNEDKSEVMKRIPITGLELETAGSAQIAGLDAANALIVGKTLKTSEILKAMYEIAATGGVSKDRGVGCLKTALGYGCPYPHKGCIASACPYCVLTSAGIESLLDVIRDYMSKLQTTGDIKYKEILEQKIIPNFKDVLEELYKNMKNEEKETLKKYIGDNL